MIKVMLAIAILVFHNLARTNSTTCPKTSKEEEIYNSIISNPLYENIAPVNRYAFDNHAKKDSRSLKVNIGGKIVHRPGRGGHVLYCKGTHNTCAQIDGWKRIHYLHKCLYGVNSDKEVCDLGMGLMFWVKIGMLQGKKHLQGMQDQHRKTTFFYHLNRAVSVEYLHSTKKWRIAWVLKEEVGEMFFDGNNPLLWHHVAVTMATKPKTYMAAYLDGIKVASNDDFIKQRSDYGDPPSTLAIGSIDNYNYTIFQPEFYLDNLTLYNRAINDHTVFVAYWEEKWRPKNGVLKNAGRCKKVK